MKNFKKASIAVALTATVAVGSSFIAGKSALPAFGSSTEKTVGPKTIKVPYTDVISYFGYAEKDSEDEIIDGKKFTFIYVWVPAVAPELGVRMMSPTKGITIKGATEAPNYAANKDSDEFFDTYITLEKSNILSADKVTAEDVKGATWTKLAQNDDSSEMPKIPTGSNYNSLLRYQSEASNPAKALTKGLYRIGFTTFKKGEVKGTFLAEVAAPIKLPGVVVNKDLNEIIKEINK